MARRRVVPTIHIAPQFPPVMSDPGIVVPNVTPQASIAGKHGSSAQTQHQQNSRNRPFHIVSSSAVAVLWIKNTAAV
jgi:hypothetical protein